MKVPNFFIAFFPCFNAPPVRTPTQFFPWVWCVQPRDVPEGQGCRGHIMCLTESFLRALLFLKSTHRMLGSAAHCFHPSIGAMRLKLKIADKGVIRMARHSCLRLWCFLPFLSPETKARGCSSCCCLGVFHSSFVCRNSLSQGRGWT